MDSNVLKQTGEIIAEGRILIIGTQIFLGIQFRIVFEKGFENISNILQLLMLVALFLGIIVLMLLLWPTPYHQIAMRGRENSELHAFATRVMALALLPFAMGLALTSVIAFVPLLGVFWGALLGVAALLLSLFFWYGIESVQLHRKGIPLTSFVEHDAMSNNDEKESNKKKQISSRIQHILQEARMVLPGTQALFGFQFAALFVEGFEKLPEYVKYVHLVSLGLILISIVLLMTPAAYHRIAERGHDSEHFYSLAAKFILAAMVPLALGISGDVYVVVHKVTHTEFAAIGSAVVVLILLLGCWFGYTGFKRVAASA